MDEETIKARLAWAMKERRRQLDISQEVAAMRCKLNRTYYAQVEVGKRNVGVENLAKIASGLGLRVSELLALAESKD